MFSLVTALSFEIAGERTTTVAIEPPRKLTAEITWIERRIANIMSVKKLSLSYPIFDLLL